MPSPAPNIAVSERLKSLQTPEFLLMLMASAVPLSFATWSALISNFSVEQVALDGSEFGLLQSVREIPGFLAFGIVFVLLIAREQVIAVVALLMLGIGTAITGFFPTLTGLLFTTILMSIGYHYYESIQTSLTLQWIDKRETPLVMGKLIAVGSFAALAAYLIIFAVLTLLNFGYATVFAVGGLLSVAIAVIAYACFPAYAPKTAQHKKLILRKRYWLYYLLIFLSGARRQIFVVFAAFLMVEKFGYGPAALTLLFLVNCAINLWLAPVIGKLIKQWGERSALCFEYTGLIIVFVSYALVESGLLAAALYILDHLFFALAIAIKTYFQKIADEADIAATAGVSFTINHIAAVILPVLLGMVWLQSPSAVFMCGAALAFCSLILSLLVPKQPSKGNEVSAPFHGLSAPKAV